MRLGFRIYFKDHTETVYADQLTPEVSESKTVYSAHVGDADITWTVTAYCGGMLVDLEACGIAPLGITRIDSLFFDLRSPSKTVRFVPYGNNLWRSEPRFPSELKDASEYASDGMGVFGSLDGKGTVLASVAPFTCVTSAGVIRRGDAFELFAKTEYTKAMSQQCRLRTERLFFAESMTMDALFDVYRALLPRSTFEMPRLTGWNSWDYYLDKVTPEDLYENIEALKKTPFADKLDYIMIDSGWEKAWGDWYPNEKFACGLDAVADRIREAGFIPGIWLSPLLTTDNVEDFEQRTGWLCRDSKGNFVKDSRHFVIDPTVPEAHAFILECFARLYRCGYRLFKIDYLAPLLGVKDLYDKTATPYSALRALIADAKAVMGEDAVILGCSLPLQCGADVTPSMRIAVDIHNHFPHVRWIAESLAWMWMYNGIVTRIDIDFLVVRGEETANEPLKWEGEPKFQLPKRRETMTNKDFFMSRWRNGEQFNAIEAETWARLVSITGGNIFLSDRISALNERGIQIIRDAFDLVRESARPVFLPDDIRLPSLWMADDLLLLINWEDTPVTKTVTGIDGTLCGTGDYSFSNQALTVSLLPHESFLAHIRREA